MKRIRPCLLLLAAVAAACSDEPAPGPGTMTATLVSPNGAEGAAVVVLVGDGVGEVTAAGTTEVYARAGSTSTQVVMINQAGGELAFQVALADVTTLPTVAIQEVAGPDDELRDELTDYRVEFRR